jgi:hypothetical protein
MIYHYGRNWVVPSGGAYTLRARVEPPTFMRHDEVNGRRLTEPVELAYHRREGRAGPGLTVRIAYASVLGIPSLLTVGTEARYGP